MQLELRAFVICASLLLMTAGCAGNKPDVPAPEKAEPFNVTPQAMPTDSTSLKPIEN